MVHIAQVRLPGWRRFTDLTITDIPATAKLVVLAGPNGVGKSSVFDGFRAWQGQYVGTNWDPIYYRKIGAPTPAEGVYAVSVQFHEQALDVATFARQAFTFRTAYRMEADFQAQSVSTLPPLDAVFPISRMSDTDSAVSQNFQRLLAQAVGKLFGQDRERTIGQVQDELLGLTRNAMSNVFEDLEVENITDPLQGGAFYFSKGSARSWHYKNLSGGERAAFDLLLDMAVKRPVFPDAIFCVDEPEIHLNTRVQGALLRQMMELLPENSQLWIATHSIGMLKEARNRQESNGDVAFLDFEGQDMDQYVELRPTRVSRAFWSRTLRVALDDLAELVAPRTVVLVEGRPSWNGPRRGNAEFDARCLRNIFSVDLPDTEFMSVGGAEDVEADNLKLGITTPMLVSGARVIRVVDRDDRSPDEVNDLRKEGVRVLKERDLENYLFSDEMIEALCDAHDPSLKQRAIQEKADLLKRSVEAGKPADDIKAISGELYVWLKKELKLTQVGNKTSQFLRDTMTAYIKPGTETYGKLREAIFGEG